MPGAGVNFKRQQRWAESEKLTPNPITNTPDPIPKSVSLPILNSGSSPCPSLISYLFIQYISDVYKARVQKSTPEGVSVFHQESEQD